MGHLAGLRDGVGNTFAQEQRICSTLLGHYERLSHMGTAHRKRKSGVHGLAWEAYMSCVSDFSCRMYIDSNHHESQI
jgi:hypothetical protein